MLRTLDDGPDESQDWSAAVAPDVRQVVHDPHNRRELAFLTHAADQMPIYLHRSLVDADVVLPIGCLRFADANGYCGVHTVICPTFCDAETQRRFRGFHTTDVAGQHQGQAREKSDEVAWLLGVLYTIQIIPAEGDAVLEVLAGEPEAVARHGQQRLDAVWGVAAPNPAKLVVGAVAGGPRAQNWDDVGRALAIATELVDQDGAVAVCCDLSTQPPPAFQQLVDCDDPHEAIRRLRKDRLPHAVAATQLAQALKRAHVFLLSRLPAEDVEDLGVTPVADAKEIARLIQLHDSCVLIDGAQYAGVRREGE